MAEPGSIGAMKGPSSEKFDDLVVQYQPLIHKINPSLYIYRNEDGFYLTGLIGLWNAAQFIDEKKAAFRITLTPI